MTLWWLHPEWKEALCISCGRKIWPEGDPDWGECYECLSMRLDDERRQRDQMMYPCDICGEAPAVAGVNGYGVCSEACDIEASLRSPKE